MNILAMTNQTQAVITFRFEIPFYKGKIGAGLDYRALQYDKAMILGWYSIFFPLNS